MLKIGQAEIDAVSRVIKSENVFRYDHAGTCERFETRYGKHLKVKYVHMTASGTQALTAALVGLEIGPGCEVLVPAHTYMASAIAVLAVGAIPVIVDVDESLTLDPDAAADAVGPRTQAVMPVHMWGLPCDMDRIMSMARKHKLKVIEDACQGVGGGYKGRKLGSFGHANAFSFNYFKNMTCGEGGAVVSNHARVMKRACCAIDCASYYWNGRDKSLQPFAFTGARATEISGAIMNVQLDRLPGMIKACRAEKKKILKATARMGLTSITNHSLSDECGTCIGQILPTAKQAKTFGQIVGGTIAGNTGRHVFTEWDQILSQNGGPNRGMNPYRFKLNQRCRRRVRKSDYSRSLEILSRAVLVRTHPDHTDTQIDTLIRKHKKAAEAAGVKA